MVLILTPDICNDYPKWSSKYRSKDGTKKICRYWRKITNKRQYTLWDLLENKNKIRTNKA